MTDLRINLFRENLHVANARIAELEAELAEIKGSTMITGSSDYVFVPLTTQLAAARNEAREETFDKVLSELAIHAMCRGAESVIRALKSKGSTKPMEPEVVYNLAAMEFRIDDKLLWGTFFRWGKTPEGFEYWRYQQSHPTQEGRDKIRAMREQFERENA